MRILIRGSKIKSHKEVTKQQESMFFFLFLLDDRRIRIWIRNTVRQNGSKLDTPSHRRLHEEHFSVS
jgi:hypothetical protein